MNKTQIETIKAASDATKTARKCVSYDTVDSLVNLWRQRATAAKHGPCIETYLECVADLEAALNEGDKRGE